MQNVYKLSKQQYALHLGHIVVSPAESQSSLKKLVEIRTAPGTSAGC